MLSGDFELEIKFSTTQQSGVQYIFDGVQHNAYVLLVDTQIYTGSGATIKIDGVQYSNGSDITGLLNGETRTLQNISNNPAIVYDFLAIGQRPSGGNRFNGQLSDLKIWDGGDRNTGTLILDLPMSEGLKDVYDEVFYRNRIQAQAEWLLNLNGGYSSHQRLWNPDAADPSFSLEAYFDASVDGTIVAQNISANGVDREFQIWVNGATGDVNLVVGGLSRGIAGTGVGLYRIDWDGTTYSLFKDGIFIASAQGS